MVWNSFINEPPEGETMLVDGPEFMEPSTATFIKGEWLLMANGCDTLHYPASIPNEYYEVSCPEVTHWMRLPERAAV